MSRIARQSAPVVSPVVETCDDCGSLIRACEVICEHTAPNGDELILCEPCGNARFFGAHPEPGIDEHGFGWEWVPAAEAEALMRAFPDLRS